MRPGDTTCSRSSMTCAIRISRTLNCEFVAACSSLPENLLNAHCVLSFDNGHKMWRGRVESLELNQTKICLLKRNVYGREKEL